MELSDRLRSALESFNLGIAHLLRRNHWYPGIVAHGGYGNLERARIMARVLMTRREDDRNWLGEKAGWRQYFDAQMPRQPVLVTAGDVTEIVETDEGGYIDLTVAGHNLPAGWRHAQIRSINNEDWDRCEDRSLEGLRSARVRVGKPTTVPIRIVSPAETLGVISDVDDTAMITMMPRPLHALRIAFMQRSDQRQPVPGMAKFLSYLGGKRPTLYLSTGAWNVVPTLRKFLTTHNFPAGTMLMRPWGLSATGFPPSGVTHKLTQFDRLTEMLPHVRWYLVGDNGQKDPTTFTEIARRYPDRVAGIFIRTLSGQEHLLQHGSPMPTHELGIVPPTVPIFTGEDGYVLLQDANDHFGDREVN